MGAAAACDERTGGNSHRTRTLACKTRTEAKVNAETKSRLVVSGLVDMTTEPEQKKRITYFKQEERRREVSIRSWRRKRKNVKFAVDKQKSVEIWKEGKRRPATVSTNKGQRSDKLKVQVQRSMGVFLRQIIASVKIIKLITISNDFGMRRGKHCAILNTYVVLMTKVDGVDGLPNDSLGQMFWHSFRVSLEYVQHSQFTVLEHQMQLFFTAKHFD